jgi:hypothetical protein
MLDDRRVEKLPAMPAERRQRSFFICLHEAAVTDHVGGQDGSKAALDAFFGHRMSQSLDRLV